MNIVLNWPQITLLVLMAMGFGLTLSLFGQPKRDKYDFIDLIVGPAVYLWLLWEGGFFG